MNKNIIILLSFILLCGCGYTTSGSLYQGNRIYVVPVANKIDIASESRNYSGYTAYPALLENRLTSVLVSEFNERSNLKVVSNEIGALHLTCSIEDYEKEALRYTDSDDVKEQRLRLRVRMKLTDPEGVVLEQRSVVGETSFFLYGSNRKSESSAQQDLIKDTARRIVEAITEEW